MIWLWGVFHLLKITFCKGKGDAFKTNLWMVLFCELKYSPIFPYAYLIICNRRWSGFLDVCICLCTFECFFNVSLCTLLFRWRIHASVPHSHLPFSCSLFVFFEEDWCVKGVVIASEFIFTSPFALNWKNSNVSLNFQMAFILIEMVLVSLNGFSSYFLSQTLISFS